MLASGTGTTFAALTDACREPPRRAEVVLLIASRRNVPAIALAQNRGVDHVVADAHSVGVMRSDIVMLQALRDHGVALVVLAGYLRKVGPQTLRAFPGRIINTHPAPLPRFGGRGMYGEHVHHAVLQSGVPMSAATLHLVDGEYDTGRVIAERPVPVNAGDTITGLKARVQLAERELLAQTVRNWS